MLIGLVANDATDRRERNQFARALNQKYNFHKVSLAMHDDDDDDQAAKDSIFHHQTNNNKNSLCFQTEKELIDYCTANWHSDFVLVLPRPRSFEAWQRTMQVFRKRPLFLCFGFEGGMGVELIEDDGDGDKENERDSDSFSTVKKAHRHNNSATNLLPWSCILSQCDLILLTATSTTTDDDDDKAISMDDLMASMLLGDGNGGKSQVFNCASLVRPPWDCYFLRLADLAAQRSNCMKRRVGAVIVAENRRVISTGYNGTPRGLINCNEGGCDRCNNPEANGCGQALETCLCIHAEENALLEAGNSRSDGATLYCCTCPCIGCAKKIVQAGIRRVVYCKGYGPCWMSCRGSFLILPESQLIKCPWMSLGQDHTLLSSGGNKN